MTAADPGPAADPGSAADPGPAADLGSADANSGPDAYTGSDADADADAGSGSADPGSGGSEGSGSEGPDSADWPALRAAARDAMSRAYAPYSGFPVGAAALVDDGRTVTGCNVENASYGLALCAECGLVSALYATGGGRLTAFTCVDRRGELLMPCGRCRQLLWEHGGAGMLIETPDGVRTLRDVLPYPFGPDDLRR